MRKKALELGLHIAKAPGNVCVFLLNAASSLFLLRLGLEEEEEMEKLDMALHTCNPSGLTLG